jgi:hypothetical protein
LVRGGFVGVALIVGCRRVRGFGFADRFVLRAYARSYLLAPLRGWDRLRLAAKGACSML